MFTFVIILIILLAILLGVVVLIQNPKGGGLSSSFGGVGQQLLGARRSTDVVEKLTWGFAGAMLFLCFATAFFIKGGDASTTNSTTNTVNTTDQEIMKKAASHPVPLTNPGTPANAPAKQP